MGTFILIMRVKFDANSVDWKLLFLHQKGAGEISKFRGIVAQRGAGFGSILRTLIRLIPAFISSPVGVELASAVRNVRDDVVQGENFLGSVKKHGRQAVKNMTGIGKKKRKQKMVGFIRNINKPHFLS